MDGDGIYQSGNPKYVYQDCKCLFEDLSNPMPTCALITFAELQEAHMTEDGLTDLCKKNINNAFENVPLSDNVYSLLGITTGEMLHIRGVGLLKYMFASLECLISLTRSKKPRKVVDKILPAREPQRTKNFMMWNTNFGV